MYLFTGVPWALLGYSQVPFLAVAQAASVVGVLGGPFGYKTGKPPSEPLFNEKLVNLPTFHWKLVLRVVFRFFTPMAFPGHLKYLGFHKPLSSGTTEMTFEAKYRGIAFNFAKLIKSTVGTHFSAPSCTFAVFAIWLFRSPPGPPKVPPKWIVAWGEVISSCPFWPPFGVTF